MPKYFLPEQGSIVHRDVSDLAQHRAPDPAPSSQPFVVALALWSVICLVIRAWWWHDIGWLWLVGVVACCLPVLRHGLADAPETDPEPVCPAAVACWVLGDDLPAACRAANRMSEHQRDQLAADLRAAANLPAHETDGIRSRWEWLRTPTCHLPTGR